MFIIQGRHIWHSGVLEELWVIFISAGINVLALCELRTTVFRIYNVVLFMLASVVCGTVSLIWLTCISLCGLNVVSFETTVAETVSCGCCLVLRYCFGGGGDDGGFSWFCIHCTSFCGLSVIETRGWTFSVC